MGVYGERLSPLYRGNLLSVWVMWQGFSLQVPRALLATVAAVLICGFCTLAITTRWKISFHLVGVAGAVTVFTLLFGEIGIVVIPLVGLVGWARWRLQVHTVAQAIAGTALTLITTVGMFRVFGLI